MSLTAADVAEIMKILEGSSFDEVMLEIDGLKLSMRRGAGGDGTAAAAAVTGTRAATAPGPAAGMNAAGPAVAINSASGTGPGAAATTSGAALKGSASGAGGVSDSSSPPAASISEASAAADPTMQEVTSPLLGTCYRAPKPGAPPFVEVGTFVDEETVVAIVEVMKLMNTVRAGVKGTVTEILMRDGALVEYGEPLLRIRKAG